MIKSYGNITFRKAERSDVEAVFSLYRSLVGTSGCVWNEFYPLKDDVSFDAENGCLYVMCLENGKIIGAASASVDDEQNSLPCWNGEIKNPCGLLRVGVASEYQHMGLAGKLVSYIEADVYKRGFDGIRLLAYEKNLGAVALYRRLSYNLSGQAVMYDVGNYFCFEKKLTPENTK